MALVSDGVMAKLRTQAGRARRAARKARALRLVSEPWPSPEQEVRLAFRLILNRDPDPEGLGYFAGRLASGEMTTHQVAQDLLASAEYEMAPRYPDRLFNFSQHWSRRDFVRTLPPAKRILDLGGSWKWSDQGALVELGYPYDFERLTIVDLPSDLRHPSYQSDEHVEVVTPRGPVAYDYRSMTDLDHYGDAMFEGVYMGQSIEHITTDEARHVLGEIRRVLEPGGWLAIDTPNGRVCRLQQAEFIDPDHKVEYEQAELRELITSSGLTIEGLWGLNYMGDAAARGQFSATEAAGNRGMYAAADDCYLFAVLARRP